MNNSATSAATWAGPFGQRQRRDDVRLQGALERALELLDLTLADDRWRGPRRREISRAREVVCDFLVGDNDYASTGESLDAYFFAFAWRLVATVDPDVVMLIAF
jgi:hypothetical protein